MHKQFQMILVSLLNDSTKCHKNVNYKVRMVIKWVVIWNLLIIYLQE
jgi:hypothetical protein